MPFVAAEVKLSSEIIGILSKYAKSRTLSACQIQRAKIILLANQGKNNNEISEEVDLSQTSVSKWRTRWIRNSETFATMEHNERERLEEEILFFLKDIQRPGCPCRITEEQIIQILEIACRNPLDFGYETSHWSLNQLVSVVTKLGIVESISPASVSRFLKYGEHQTPSRSLLASFNRKIR
jgi:transposase